MARKCMSVNDLVRKSGVSISTLKLSLRGKNVRPETIGKLARALDVDAILILSSSAVNDRKKQSINY